MSSISSLPPTGPSPRTTATPAPARAPNEADAALANLAQALQAPPDFSALEGKQSKQAIAKQRIDAALERIRVLMLLGQTDPTGTAEEARRIARDIGSAVGDYSDAVGDAPLQQADRDFAREAARATDQLDGIVARSKAQAGADATGKDAPTFRSASDEIADARKEIDTFLTRTRAQTSVDISI